MSTYAHPVPRVIPEIARHPGWFALVCSVAFLVLFVGVAVLGLRVVRDAAGRGRSDGS